MSQRKTITLNGALDRRAVLKTLAAGVSACAVAAEGSVSRAATTPSDAELIELPAHAAIEHIRRGDLSAESYAEALLNRYKAHKNLNTVTYIDEARVLEDARAVDQARAKGAQLGRLAGLPIMLKDNFNTIGFATTAGSPFLKGYQPKANAPVADMLFKQGAVLFAKSNMHELAIGGTSSNLTFGFVKNPYDLSRIPGGSTGGTAAALAARIIPLGFGSDTSGSCRMPAHFCGVVGFRPSNPKTSKPYPVDGIVPNVLDFDVPGPLARNVIDIALTHSVVTNQVALAPAELRGVRIGIPRSYFWETMDPDVAKIMEAALEKLRGAGAVLVEIDLGDVVKASLPVISLLNHEGKRTDLAAFLAQEYPAMSINEAIAGIASKTIRARLQAARDKPASPEAVVKARAAMDALGAQYQDALRQQAVTAVAFPTMPVPAPLLPTDEDTLPKEVEISGRKYPDTVLLRNSLPGPLWRVPGLSIPAGLTPAGLPAGLELEGLAGQDNQLLSLGMAVEAVLGPVPAPTFRNG
jgi:Asp-tRNA(Asn)/Glu-tRNA(Gln) amidotransferase A subunit family amidase